MHAIIINLSLAVFWHFMGFAIVVTEWMNGQHLVYPVLGISVGWWLQLVSAYNWLRVWWVWSSQRARESGAPEEMTHRRVVRREPPDPNFQFTDPPAPEPQGETKEKSKDE